MEVIDEMRNNMKCDFEELRKGIANSAQSLAMLNQESMELSQAASKAERARIEREKRVAAGAEASIAQKVILEQQVDSINNQNVLLSNNYSVLQEMYKTQVKAYRDSQEELIHSRRQNYIMMIVSIIAMIAAVASPIVSIMSN